jgi:hypothetical protein
MTISLLKLCLRAKAGAVLSPALRGSNLFDGGENDAEVEDASDGVDDDNDDDADDAHDAEDDVFGNGVILSDGCEDDCVERGGGR